MSQSLRNSQVRRLAPERLWRKWSQQLRSFFFKICDATVTVDFRRQQRRDNFWLQRTATLLPSIFFPAAVGSSRASVLFSFRRQQVSCASAASPATVVC
nr:hypothetical protein Iba_chr14aCG9580 [Ipomoea batatas]